MRELRLSKDVAQLQLMFVVIFVFKTAKYKVVKW